MRFIGLALITFLFYVNVAAQDESKWQDIVDDLILQEVKEVENSEGLIVLTGSSSARMWKNFGEVFPTYTTVNNGFGGSQMYELLFHLDELVINYKPDKVLIYEGDNDISAGKSVEEIMKTTARVVDQIRSKLPNAEIYLISPKPSLARWELSEKYVDLNEELRGYSDENDGLEYIDVWYPMLNEGGMPMEDIFIEDGLHMNEKGYEIWKNVVKERVNH